MSDSSFPLKCPCYPHLHQLVPLGHRFPDLQMQGIYFTTRHWFGAVHLIQEREHFPRCFQTLSDVPWGQASSCLRTTGVANDKWHILTRQDSLEDDSRWLWVFSRSKAVWSPPSEDLSGFVFFCILCPLGAQGLISAWVVFQAAVKSWRTLVSGYQVVMAQCIVSFSLYNNSIDGYHYALIL